MSDRPEGQKPESMEAKQVETSARVNKNRGVLKPLILAVILVGAVVAAYKIGIQVGSTGQNESASAASPSFSRGSSENLFSSSNLLKVVGQSPVDPAKVLFPSMERSLDPQAENKPKACPPGPLGARLAGGPVAAGAKKNSGQIATADGTGTKQADNPAIETKQPGVTTALAPQERQAAEPLLQPSKTETQQSAPPVPDATKKREPKLPDAPTGTVAKARDPEERTKSEQFQLPGSVKVKIQNYSGNPAKWGLMVIVDDSASMGRKTRVWGGGRLKSAEAVLGKLPDVVTPGSKVSVRDFQCKKTESDQKNKESSCLSRIVLDWAESPFAGLKEKLENLSAAGKTNPCAAALYSLRKDFSSQSGITPRVLIITDGAGKCSPADATKLAEQTIGKDRVHVDVMALGMGKKKNSGYTILAKKTDGMFFRLEGPGEVDQAVAKYAKALKTPKMEKVEIRGEKAVFSVTPEEEIALTPGTYSVVLPLVAGISAGKRTISQVKVGSGEAVVIDVKAKKGKVSVSRSGKKSIE